ncbi:MAG: MFS transporter [Anaerolineae bacterium]|nr:MFS transporter [Anaerolineae bacterium]
MPNVLDNNIRLLYAEIFFAAIMGGIMSFNSAFVVRLGASENLVGLLSAAPPLIAVALSMPAARMLERRSDRRPFLFGNLIARRAGFLGLSIIPLLVSAENAAVWLVIWQIALHVPFTLFVAGWTPLMADLIPERRRALVFSRRNIINSVVMSVVTSLAGFWLSAYIFPYNYQVMYAVGVITAMISCLALERLVVPPSAVVEHTPAGRAPRKRAVFSPGRLRVLLRENRAFAIMTFNTWIRDFGMQMAWPLFTIYFVRDLGASDAWIGTNASLRQIATVAGFMFWERVIRHKGFYWVMARTMPMIFVYPLLMVLIPDLTVITLVGMFISFTGAGTTLSHINVLIKLCPREHRASYLGVYNTIMNVGAFLAPMVSTVLLVDWIGLEATLLVSAVLRLFGGLLFFVFKFEEPPEEVWAPPAAPGVPRDPQDEIRK